MKFHRMINQREPRDFSPDSMLYLFYQKPYKTKIGA